MPTPSRIFTVFCLVTTAIVAAAWARSYRFGESVLISAPSQNVLVTSHPGRLCADWPFPPDNGSVSHGWILQATTARRDVQPFAIADEKPYDCDYPFATRPQLKVARVTIAAKAVNTLEVPYWMLIVGPAGITILALLMNASGWIKRLRRGMCRHCGYDLRASGDRCPECGRSRIAENWLRRWRQPLTYSLLAVSGVASCLWLSRVDLHSASAMPLDVATLNSFPFNDEHDVLADCPRPIQDLDGQRVEVQGLMIPLDDHIHQFAVVPRLTNRNGGGVPGICEVVAVTMPKGRTVEYSPNRMRVRGTLHVRLSHDEGYIVTLYDMTADEVEPVRK